MREMTPNFDGKIAIRAPRIVARTRDSLAGLLCAAQRFGRPGADTQSVSCLACRLAERDGTKARPTVSQLASRHLHHFST